MIVVDVTELADNATPPSVTTTPGRNPLPVIVILTVPLGSGFGVTEVICGPAINNVIACEPEILVLLASCALIPSLVYAGTLAGAV